jgi:predicted  nucleic acid-binding Zn-ribbon protein
MARREIDDEKKSYSGVFLLVVGLLLVGGIWSVWDDYISRRPWKKYQAVFSLIAYDKAQDELRQEEERLQNDPAYQEARAKLEEARARLRDGEVGKRLAALTAELAGAELRASELETSLRIVRSEIEAAWYEYEHAQMTGHGGQEEKQTLDALTAEAQELEERFHAAQAERDRVQREIDELNLELQTWENKVRELATPRERIKQRLDSYVLLSFDGFAVPKIPTIQQTVLPEFDRGNFDTPLMRVDRCQSCHAGIDRGGFEDQPNPYKTHPHREVLLGNHPPERFGCTPCHEGQGVATTSVEKAHGEVMFWEHPLRRGDKVEANCIKCHADVPREPDCLWGVVIYSARLSRLPPRGRVRRAAEDWSVPPPGCRQGRPLLDGPLGDQPARVPSAHPYAELPVHGRGGHGDYRLPARRQ